MNMSIERIPIESKGSWLDLRRRDVTASQVGALFGAHAYLTPLMLFQQKMGSNGQQGDSPSMRRGRIMESAVAAAVAEENPEWAPIIAKANDYWRLPDLRLGATPDFYVGNPDDAGFGLIEAKSVSPEKFTDWGEAAPLQYTLQTLAQMMCSGAAWGTIAMLQMNRALTLHLYAVPRHAAAEAKIADAVCKFWNSVDRGEPPPPVMPQDRETLIRMFPRETPGEEISLDGDNEVPGLLAEWATLRGATKRLQEITDCIRVKVGSASTARCAGWTIHYKTQHKKAYTVPEKDVRVLRIVAPRNGNGDIDD
jgi:predicted phage-related endonuclease